MSAHPPSENLNKIPAWVVYKFENARVYDAFSSSFAGKNQHMKVSSLE